MLYEVITLKRQHEVYYFFHHRYIYWGDGLVFRYFYFLFFGDTFQYFNGDTIGYRITSYNVCYTKLLRGTDDVNN